MFPLCLYLLMVSTQRLSTAQLTFPEDILKDSMTPYSCRLNPVAGLCRSQIRRYFYNITSGVCQAFSYSGCTGNDNNFHTTQQCVGACVCSKPAVSNPCSNSVAVGLQRVYFDSISGQCKQLAYGTCMENTNMYPSLHQCQQTCSLCQLIRDSGPCKGSYRRYYFDNSHNRCVEFFYGGCGGNANNFLRKSECEKICSPKQNISVRIVKNTDLLRIRYPNISSANVQISKPVANWQLSKTLFLRPHSFVSTFNNGKYLLSVSPSVSSQKTPSTPYNPARHLRLYIEHNPQVIQNSYLHHHEASHSAEEASITEEPQEIEASQSDLSSATTPPLRPRTFLFRLRLGKTTKEKVTQEIKRAITTNSPVQWKRTTSKKQTSPANSVLDESNTSRHINTPETRKAVKKSGLTVEGVIAKESRPYLSGYVNSPIGWNMTGQYPFTTPRSLPTSTDSTRNSISSNNKQKHALARTISVPRTLATPVPRTQATLNGQSPGLSPSGPKMSSLTTSNAVKFILNLISAPYNMMNVSHNHGLA
ncbi:uncharacterized protein [Haliotis asinina]|uniref:uncharacterized protein n=1 Tax=Haliotis asinina TaxID=109174 RepID=UPI003531E86C